MRRIGRKKEKNNKILNIHKPNKEHHRINLRTNNQNQTVMLHRLVLDHFGSNPNAFKYIEHIDDDFDNCKIDNLRWVEKKPTRNHKNDVPDNTFDIVDPETGIKWREVRWTDGCYQLSEKGKIRRVKAVKYERERGKNN